MATQLTSSDVDRDRLLAALLNPPVAAPQVEPAPAPAAPQAVPRPRRHTRAHPFGDMLASLFAVVLGAGLWAIDGYFSLIALQALGLPVVAVVAWPWQLSAAALASWAIPLGVEAVEQVFFPTGARGWRLALFVGVAGVNILATGLGLWTAFSGRSAFGVSLVEGSQALWAVSIFGGLALAFLPGRLALAALGALWGQVR